MESANEKPYLSTVNLRTHEDTTPHDLLMITSLERIMEPIRMVAIEITRSLYVYDVRCKCIWKLNTDYYKVKKWLSALSDDIWLSVTSDNHLLVLSRSLQSRTHLKTYDQKAKLLRRVSLSDDFRFAFGAIQTLNREIIVIHRLRFGVEMLVSILSTGGHVINQSTLAEKNSLYYEHFFLYSVNGYLFVSRKLNRHGYYHDVRLPEIFVHSVWFCCDGEKNQFMVATESGVEILTLNIN